MAIKIEVYDLYAQVDIYDDIIFPTQTHSTNIIEIKTGKENLENCDGIFTSMKNNYSLGIVTADCAAICFYDKEKYGIIHAGWRGLVNGIIEKMMNIFDKPNIFISPLLEEFEVQKDQCYYKIKNQLGTKFFKIKEDGQIIFQFQKAIRSILSKNAVFDERDTYKNKKLASWRRDRNKQRNYTIISNINL